MSRCTEKTTISVYVYRIDHYLCECVRNRPLLMPMGTEHATAYVYGYRIGYYISLLEQSRPLFMGFC